MDQLSPKTDIPSRIKLRDEIIRKIYTNVEDVVNLFLSYELNYFDVILIISIPQYLTICQKGTMLTKPDQQAFISYSFLSLSLEAPVKYQEYTNAVQTLLSLKSYPKYLENQIQFLLQIVQEGVEENPQCPVQRNDEPEETERLDILHPSIDLSPIFDKEPDGIQQERASSALYNLLCTNDNVGDMVAALIEATKEFTDFSKLLNYFSRQKDIYQRFTSFILALALRSYNEQSMVQNDENNSLSIFKRTYNFSSVKEYIHSLIQNAAQIYYNSVPFIQTPKEFDKFLSTVLDTCAEFTSDPMFYLLAAVQLNNEETIPRFVSAVTYSFHYSKKLDQQIAECGVEFFFLNKEYSTAFSQFVDNVAIRDAVIFKHNFTLNDLIQLMPFFFNMEFLRKCIENVKEPIQPILACMSHNINVIDTNPFYVNVYTMKLLNTLNRNFFPYQLNIFQISKE